MNSAHTFAVETAASVAAIISDTTVLSDALIAAFKERGIEVRVLNLSSGITANSRQQLVNVDYLVCLSQSVLIERLVGSQGLWNEINNLAGPYARKYLFVNYQYLDLARTLDGNPLVGVMGEWIGDKEGCAPTLDKLLADCRDHKELHIPGDGLDHYNLITQQDLNEGIIKFVFSISAPQLIYLMDPQPSSYLNLAYEIRSSLPFKIKIAFSPIVAPTLFDSLLIRQSQSKIDWHPGRGLSGVLQSYIDHYFSRPRAVNVQEVIPIKIASTSRTFAPPPTTLLSEPTPTLAKNTNITKTLNPVFVPLASPTRRRLQPLRAHVVRHKKSIPPRWRIPLMGLVIALGLYIGSLTLALTITFLSVNNLRQSVANGGFISSQAASVARPPAVYLQANLTFISELIPSVTIRSLNQLFSAYILALDTAMTASDLAAISQRLTGYVLGEEETDIVGQINLARVNVSKLYDNLSLLDGSLPLEPPSVIPQSQKSSYTSIKSRIKEGRRAALAGKSLLAIAPDILGVGERRKYAILFQNNMELRSTGGFIGSFGIISLENGKLFDIQVYDVYSADGQLKGHVEPPEEIKKYLGEANWYLRDSNWDPDFPTTARRVEWFLGKTMSQEVQGVIGINLYTLQDILRAIGSVHLAEYDEQITADNLFERAEYHAEVNFFPGSTQKKEFIGSLADVVIDQLRHLDGNRILDITHAITKSIDEKNTILALGSSSSNRSLSALGWNGELRDVPCPDSVDNCNRDYLMLVDNNFGVNKANYFLKRQLDLTINILEDFSLSHQLKVEYRNTAKSSAWPAGPYKNYSRLFLPPGSVVSSAKVGNKVLKSEEIKVTNEDDHTTIGFLVEVPLDSTVVVTVDYATPSTLTDKSSTYSLYWQKQSGTAADSLNIHLTYPTSLEANVVSPQADYKPGKLDFALSNITDRRVTVKFK